MRPAKADQPVHLRRLSGAAGHCVDCQGSKAFSGEQERLHKGTHASGKLKKKCFNVAVMGSASKHQRFLEMSAIFTHHSFQLLSKCFDLCGTYHVQLYCCFEEFTCVF